MLLCGTATAESARWTYKSPDEKRVVQVDRTSEAPVFAVALTQGDKTLWSYHPDPKDRSVRIFWRPNSSAFLMEHVTQHKGYRLYIISIAKDHVKMYPITMEPNIHPSSIVDGTVVWDRIRAGVGIISLTIQDQESKKRKMQITAWRKLEVEKDGKTANKAMDSGSKRPAIPQGYKDYHFSSETNLPPYTEC